MNKPNVNGVEIRAGQVWRDENGQDWSVFAVASKTKGRPVWERRVYCVNNANKWRWFTGGGKAHPHAERAVADLQTLIPRAEPELPAKAEKNTVEGFTAEQLAQDEILRHFHYRHLPDSLAQHSKPFCDLARHVVENLPRNPERTVALRKLLEAKDAAVRANVN